MNKIATIIIASAFVISTTGCDRKAKKQEAETANAIRFYFSKTEKNAEPVKVSAKISAISGFDITGVANATVKSTRPMVKPLHIEASDYLEQAKLDLENVPITQSVILNKISEIVSSLGSPVLMTIPSGTECEIEYRYDARLSGDTVELTNLVTTQANWGNYSAVAKDSRYLTNQDNVFDSIDTLKAAVSKKVNIEMSALKEKTMLEIKNNRNRIAPMIAAIKNKSFQGTAPQDGQKAWEVSAELVWNEDSSAVDGFIDWPELKSKKAWHGTIDLDEYGKPIMVMKETNIIEQGSGSTALLGIQFRLHQDQSGLSGTWQIGGYSGSIELHPKQ
jgi:hypothetical protein